MTAGDGNDTVTGGKGSYSVTLGNGNDNMTLGNGDDTVILGDGNDTTTLGNGSDVVVEGNGNDQVTAGNGADLVVGGLGRHTIELGNGNDILIDGSATVVNAGDSFRQILDDWNSAGSGSGKTEGNPGSSVAVDTRIKVVYNTSHPNVLTAGRGRDWFFFTYKKDVTNVQPNDHLN